jgi:hypothetical protein
MSPVNWIARMFPEAPLTVYRLGTKGARELGGGHPLERLIEKPKDFCNGVAL